MLEFCATNAPDQPHWTLNLCFGVFRTTWLYFRLFRCLKKLGAKRAEMEPLIQKFMPRSRVRIFRNERSRSTPLEPKLMFWCVSFHLGAFRTILLLHETCCKTCQTSAIIEKVRAMMFVRIFRN